jgi:hypothetical protein
MTVHSSTEPTTRQHLHEHDSVMTFVRFNRRSNIVSFILQLRLLGTHASHTRGRKRTRTLEDTQVFNPLVSSAVPYCIVCK